VSLRAQSPDQELSGLAPGKILLTRDQVAVADREASPKACSGSIQARIKLKWTCECLGIPAQNGDLIAGLVLIAQLFARLA